MKKDRFHITNLIKELIINIDRNLTNFPKKEIELKRQIKETAYTMLEIAYEGNATYDLEKRKNLQEKLIAKIFNFLKKIFTKSTRCDKNRIIYLAHFVL